MACVALMWCQLQILQKRGVFGRASFSSKYWGERTGRKPVPLLRIPFLTLDLWVPSV